MLVQWKRGRPRARARHLAHRLDGAPRAARLPRLVAVDVARHPRRFGATSVSTSTTSTTTSSTSARTTNHPPYPVARAAGHARSHRARWSCLRSPPPAPSVLWREPAAPRRRPRDRPAALLCRLVPVSLSCAARRPSSARPSTGSRPCRFLALVAGVAVQAIAPAWPHRPRRPPRAAPPARRRAVGRRRVPAAVETARSHPYASRTTTRLGRRRARRRRPRHEPPVLGLLGARRPATGSNQHVPPDGRSTSTTEPRRLQHLPPRAPPPRPTSSTRAWRWMACAPRIRRVVCTRSTINKVREMNLGRVSTDPPSYVLTLTACPSSPSTQR
jgi:hypothetical protein